MNLENLDKILESIRHLLSPSITFVIAVVSGFLLITTSDRLEWFGLDSLMADSRGIIGMIFLVSSIFFLVSIVILGAEKIIEKYNANKEKEARVEYLHKLDSNERYILNTFINKNKRKSLDMSIDNAGAIGLHVEGILAKPEQEKRRSGFVTYKMENWVWEYLHDHPEYLKPKVE